MKPHLVRWERDHAGKGLVIINIVNGPSAFLVGVDGKVVWEGFPLPEVGELEKKILSGLEKVKKAP